MKRDSRIVLLEGVPVADDPDRAGFLVRQVVMEAQRIEAGGRLPHVKVVSVEVAATMLVLRLHVFGQTARELVAWADAAEVVWRDVAERALKAAT